MQKLTYYRERSAYPVINGRLTLAGELRTFLDGIHSILDMKKGGEKIDGPLAQQIQPTNVLNAITDLGRNASVPQNGIPVDKGQSVEGLVALYQREARTLLAAYR
jgi:hypothetical protein